jgi:transcriptional regulator with XRE-family HTH domain
MKDINRFGELLKDCRQKFGLSQEQLAALLDVERTTVSRWERGNLISRPRDLRNKLLKCFKESKKLHFDPETVQKLFQSAGLHALDNDELKQVSYIKNDSGQNTAEPTISCQKSSETEKLAENLFADYIPTLFEKLSQYRSRPVMLLLNQAHWDDPPCRKAILAQAQKNYSNHLLNLLPPYHCANVDDCFAQLAQNSGIMSVNNKLDFHHWLQLKLESKDSRLFLLVSRFEKAAPLLMDELASLIRSFSDESDRFHVMLCGGQKLADFKYQKIGLLSLLDFANIEYWPELGIKEVKALYQHRYKKQLNDAVAKELLKISGGHPEWLNQCFQFQQQSPNDWKDLTDSYPKKLSQSETVWQCLTGMIEKDEETVQRLCELFKQKDKPLLSSWQPYILDKLLRELYWKNLLVWRDKKELYWRCEAVCMAGEKIFRCDDDKR